MQPIVTFRIQPFKEPVDLEQIASILEKRMELHSRLQFPKLWRWIDNRASKRTHKKETKIASNLRLFLGLVNWILGLFALLPAMIAPRELWMLLLFGFLCLVSGTVILWRKKKTLLIVLSFLMGVVLCFGAIGNAQALGNLLPLGIYEIGIGVWALLSKTLGTSAQRQARNYIKQFNSREPYLLFLTETGILFTSKELLTEHPEMIQQSNEVPYESFHSIVESKDYLMLIQEKGAILLQKSEIIDGSLEHLNRQQIPNYYRL